MLLGTNANSSKQIRFCEVPLIADDEVAEAEADNEDVKVLQTVEAVEADDAEADAEDDEDV